MAIVGLDHIQIAIPEGGEGKARAFYGDMLGMHEAPKPDNLAPSGCWFERGSVSLHIGIDPDFMPARKAHPALLVDDLGALRDRLEAAGYEIDDGKPINGYSRCFSFDPFGNRIEFMERV
ncbi:VOC family protein [Erythrobacter ani]|uniref:VOC family protein n=1 Tax=Erythrobacter ani TaxID=2827235 RepID=A0ABS6SP79_9SPHN|nr:VOC family protein [Erythrobacter ani]MBV7266228.1 VOC family protein [Erythrobacter ani]